MKDPPLEIKHVCQRNFQSEKCVMLLKVLLTYKNINSFRQDRIAQFEDLRNILFKAST